VDDQQERLTRREMLRTLAGTGAMLWAAPVLTTSAVAASHGTNPCEGVCMCSCCSDYPIECCDGTGYCFQHYNKYGRHQPCKTACFDLSGGSSCNDYSACDKQFRCPKGMKCSNTCCDSYYDYPPLCIPICKTPTGARSGPRRPLAKPGQPSVLFRR
jgi:hypothetical protein